MNRIAIVVTGASLLMLAGCAKGPTVVAAPAPGNALDCALRQAVQLGYQPIQGGVADGYIKFAQGNALTVGAAARETTMRVATMGIRGSNRIVENQLTVTHAGEVLRVQVVGLDRNRKATNPTGAAVADAEGMLAACAVPTQRSRVTDTGF
jgi:hypothetical protein